MMSLKHLIFFLTLYSAIKPMRNACCHPGEYIWSRSHTQADRKCIRGAGAAAAAVGCYALLASPELRRLPKQRFIVYGSVIHHLAGGQARRRTRLRHAAGFSLEGDVLNAHPDALLEGLREARTDDALTIGTGAGFAVGVRASLTVWIRDGGVALTLPRALRSVATNAGLVIEEPRPKLAEELARALRTRS